MKRPAFVVAAGALLIAIWALWQTHFPNDPLRGEAGQAEQNLRIAQLEQGDVFGARSRTAEAESQLDRAEGAQPAEVSRLVLRLVDAKGLPVAAAVSWCASPDPPRSLPVNSVIARAVALDPVGRGAMQAADGVAVIERSARTWIWARIDAAGCAHPVFVMARPAAGEVVQKIEVPPGHARLHVLVLAADLRCGTDCAAVECLDESGAVIWTGSTDAFGYAVAEIPSPGEYRVRIVGDRSDCSEHEAKVPFFADGPHDGIAVLAMSEPAIEYKVRIDAEFHRGARDMPVLLLRRLDPSREVMILVTHDLKTGSGEYALRLPAGDYLPVVLPQGRLAFVDGATVLHVDGTGSPAMPLRLADSGTVTLELRGIGPLELPIAVRCVQEDDLLDCAENRIWTGPAYWRRLHAAVGGWQGQGRIVAYNRRGVWLSAEKQCVRGGTAIVEMVRGCELTVRCRVDAVGQSKTLAARHALGEVVRVLRPALVQDSDGRQPCARAVVFVPLGEVHLQMLDEKGIACGERLMQASAPRQSLSW